MTAPGRKDGPALLNTLRNHGTKLLGTVAASSVDLSEHCFEFLDDLGGKDTGCGRVAGVFERLVAPPGDVDRSPRCNSSDGAFSLSSSRTTVAREALASRPARVTGRALRNWPWPANSRPKRSRRSLVAGSEHRELHVLVGKDGAGGGQGVVLEEEVLGRGVDVA
jgi:hypothetical protein